MIGVIADDLTGAAELGAVGVRYGLLAEIVVKGQASGQADLVCLDTDSRSCAAEEAGQRAVSAARVLEAAGARWIYKKVDSVLRGQVIAEIERILEELHLNLALLVPANPSLGRAIRDGQYFVGGKPIHETEFARDPEHPRRSPRLLDLLGTTESVPISVGRLQDALPVSGIVVGEAATSGDLQQWAARRSSGILAAGGAEFFGALLAAAGHGVSSSRAVTAGASQRGIEVFVCGSTSKSCREFVNENRERGRPVFSLPEELAPGGGFPAATCQAIAQSAVAALRSQRRVILNIGLPPVRQRFVARRLAVNLAQVAEAVLRHVPEGHVYVEGGATAAELVRQMGWSRLSVLRELAPGVATLAIGGEPRRLLTIKPGSYAWPADIR
jgi:uncharacterized protein YgbK (DUF1537 family)